MQELLKKHADKLRFGLVGIANTTLDFVLLFLLVSLGIDKIIANYISTSIAFVFSFFVNKSFTFKSKGGNAFKQFLTFLGITIVGMWIIQPLVITGVSWLLAGTGWNEGIILFIAKLVATVASLIWNYTLYSRFVFKKKEEN